jgi:hypothetical protein
VKRKEEEMEGKDTKLRRRFIRYLKEIEIHASCSRTPLYPLHPFSTPLPVLLFPLPLYTLHCTHCELL